MQIVEVCKTWFAEKTLVRNESTNALGTISGFRDLDCIGPQPRTLRPLSVNLEKIGFRD